MNRRRTGYSLLELLVIVIIAGAVAVTLGKVLLNYYANFHETQGRLRLQRDMRTLTYWIRKDLTSLARRPENVDLKSDGKDFAFVVADDPENTQDVSSNTSDGGLDQIHYVFSGRTVTRTWKPLGSGMQDISRTLALDSLDLGKGDTFSVDIVLRDADDQEATRNAFDATLGNFDLDSSIRQMEIDIVFSKQPWKVFSKNRSTITERARLSAVALYQKGG